MSKYLRIISAVLALGQVGWAAALVALGGKAPMWCLVAGACIAAVGTAAPGIFKSMEAQ
jgi:hypothetical protein